MINQIISSNRIRITKKMMIMKMQQPYKNKVLHNPLHLLLRRRLLRLRLAPSRAIRAERGARDNDYYMYFIIFKCHFLKVPSTIYSWQGDSKSWNSRSITHLKAEIFKSVHWSWPSWTRRQHALWTRMIVWR